MSILESTGADPNLYLLDIGMMGMEHYGGVYFLNAPKPAIIETGFSHSLEKMLACLDELNIKPEDVAYIMPTHVHMDHAGGAGFLAEVCPNAQVVCYEMGMPYLIDPSKLVVSVERAVGELFPFYGTMKPIPEDRMMSVSGGEIIDLGDGYKLEVIHTPGHAPHQVSFHENKTNGLFTGDAVGIYRTDASGFAMTTPPPAFHFEHSIETLDKLRSLSLDWLYFTHYGAHSGASNLIEEYKNKLIEFVDLVEFKVAELEDVQAVKDILVEREAKVLGDFYDPTTLRFEMEMNVQGVLLYLKKFRSE
jgi:glyoxylase-like metal-dependent hydrolase (beta-lactamase superfamily II)